MKEHITSFIKEKDLSENSQTAYSYDLDQFVDTVHGHISDTNLRIYQASIKDFKPAVQKRKLSAVNQFLFYLYQNHVIGEYHRLVLPKVTVAKSHDQELLDLSLFWEGSEIRQGRLIALLIVEMGLLPSEILQLKIVDIEPDFQVLRVGKEGQKRVLRIPDSLLDELTDSLTGTYLFDNNGKAYSRQWGFRQLESFLIEKGFKDLSAQSLREQYILKQREQGMDLFSIARELGLKTLVTLEKYK
ncbi:site-specific tyrosine recombinase XerD [Streptococcus rubneri]|jgi:tyrosine recombinase xerD-like|uniref:Tyrosine recombinase XerD-like n=1 Tax=Streptococcus rubneri TaxID=1234680 RepID=A0A4Z1DWE7_9STRE|nr:site-specific tyrosine recombinase XerD [Streptococcus rubneri]MBK4773642.1 site-specific tyrosine recombinase XerD [Streptococcus rubneri]TGN92385.1 site-specific tyrosine recombinase XerD [Streptococcus rubneri]